MRRLEAIASWLHARALFALARCVVVDIPLRHIQEHGGAPLGFEPTPGTALDPARAAFMWNEQATASAHTDAMVKQMVTLSSALATVVFTLLGGANPWLRSLAILGLLASVLLCLQALGVRRDAMPEVPHAIGPAGDQEWAEDLGLATRINRGAHAHRVDLYRAAWRWFVLALSVAAVAGMMRPRPRSTAYVDAEYRSAATECCDGNKGRCSERQPDSTSGGSRSTPVLH